MFAFLKASPAPATPHQRRGRRSGVGAERRDGQEDAVADVHQGRPKVRQCCCQCRYRLTDYHHCSTSSVLPETAQGLRVRQNSAIAASR